MQSSRKLFKLISGAAENGSVAQQLENGLVPTRHKSGWKKLFKNFQNQSFERHRHGLRGPTIVAGLFHHFD